jgi:hypothetical protein
VALPDCWWEQLWLILRNLCFKRNFFVVVIALFPAWGYGLDMHDHMPGLLIISGMLLLVSFCRTLVELSPPEA